jgi:hypothetical protein
MKTNDKDIEKMAVEYDQNKENVLISGWNESQKGFKAGFKACEAKMLAEASELLATIQDISARLDGIKSSLSGGVYTVDAEEFEQVFISRDILDLCISNQKALKQGGEK